MNDMVSRFISGMNKLNAKEYMFSIITYEIAPVICGIKSASLITLTKTNKGMYDLWMEFKEEFLKNIPLKYFELNNTGDAVTLLLYDEEQLKGVLARKACVSFLESYGYNRCTTAHECLCKLRHRFRICFPHEVGLFLGIPLEDVEGFIRNSGKEYIYCGYWKVYGDVENTLKLFESYSRIKKKVVELSSMNTDFVQIINFLRKYRDV